MFPPRLLTLEDIQNVKPTPKKTVAPKEYNNTPGKSLDWIESLLLVGVFRNNWSKRTIKLYADPDDPGVSEQVYSVGRTFDGSTVVTDHNKLADCMNFRIALDYWAHGQKVYERD